MIVCFCKSVNDKELSASIKNGARTIDAVGKACGAGTDCCGCHPLIHEMINLPAPKEPNPPKSNWVSLGLSV